MRDRIAVSGAFVMLVSLVLLAGGIAVGCGAAAAGHSSIGAGGLIVALLAGLGVFYGAVTFFLARRD